MTGFEIQTWGTYVTPLLEGLIDRWWTEIKGFKKLADFMCFEKWRESRRNQVSSRTKFIVELENS